MYIIIYVCISAGKSIRVYAGHDDSITSVATTRAGAFISGSADGTAGLWEERTSSRLASLLGHRASVNGVCVVQSIRDGSRLLAYTGSSDRGIRVWDAELGGSSLSEWTGHDGWVYDVISSPDGKTLFSASQDVSIRGWDTSTGECNQIFRGHTSAVTCLAFDPSTSTLYSGSEDETVRGWKLVTSDSKGSAASSV